MKNGSPAAIAESGQIGNPTESGRSRLGGGRFALRAQTFQRPILEAASGPPPISDSSPNSEPKGRCAPPPT